MALQSAMPQVIMQILALVVHNENPPLISGLIFSQKDRTFRRNIKMMQVASAIAWCPWVLLDQAQELYFIIHAGHLEGHEVVQTRNWLFWMLVDGALDLGWDQHFQKNWSSCCDCRVWMMSVGCCWSAGLVPETWGAFCSLLNCRQCTVWSSVLQHSSSAWKVLPSSFGRWLLPCFHALFHNLKSLFTSLLVWRRCSTPSRSPAQPLAFPRQSYYTVIKGLQNIVPFNST